MSRLSFIADSVKQVRKDLDKRLADLGGAKSPEMKAMGNALAKSWRKELSVKGGGSLAAGGHGPDRGGHPSRPGEPPRKQTGQLAKSIKVGVVGAGVRVGVLHFTGPILEAGVDTAEPPRKTRGRGGRLRQRTRANKGRLVIAPRPSADRAIEGAKDAMVDGFVATFEKGRLGA